MSTEEITSYRITCDEPGCDEVSEATTNIFTADDAAASAGWHLGVAYATDRCPLHAKAARS